MSAGNEATKEIIVLAQAIRGADRGSEATAAAVDELTGALEHSADAEQARELADFLEESERMFAEQAAKQAAEAPVVGGTALKGAADGAQSEVKYDPDGRPFIPKTQAEVRGSVDHSHSARFSSFGY